MLVRMPFTPLRHDGAVLDEAAWRPLVGRAKSACETNGFEFRLAVGWEEYVLTQSIGAEDTTRTSFWRAGRLEGGSRSTGPRSRQKTPRPPFAFGFLEDEEARQSLHRQYLSAVSARDGPMRASRTARTGSRSPWPLSRALRP